MEMKITFPGGLKVLAEYASGSILTDQPRKAGGDDEGPSPYTCFLASLGTCAGFYVLNFCKTRGLDAAGIELVQHNEFDPDTHLLKRVGIEIRVPGSFPEKYHSALVRAADTCAVKRALADPPIVEVRTQVV